MKKRRILLALIMLLISGIALTTATYAWFTANRAVEVEEIDVKATASGGIQISADAATWSNEITLEDLREFETNVIPTTALKPVTTVGTNGGTGAFDFYLGELDDSGTKVTLTSTEDADKNYVAFDMYLYTATEQTIVFNDGTQVVAKNVATPTSDPTDVGLKSTIRVGFLVQGTDETSTPATAKALASGVLANQVIWEPNSNTHTTYATNMLGASGTMTYMGGTQEAVEVSTTDATVFTTVNATQHLITSVTGAYPKSNLFTIQPGITKIKVYIWLEGQDIDCEDTASLGTGVGVKLNFKIAD